MAPDVQSFPSIQTSFPGAYCDRAMGSPWPGVYEKTGRKRVERSRSKTWKVATSVGNA